MLCGKMEKIHKKGITSIAYCNFLPGNIFATGGGDGQITIRTLNLRTEDRSLAHKEKMSFNLSEIGTGNKKFDAIVSLTWGEESMDDMLSEKQSTKRKTNKKLQGFKNRKTKKASPFMSSNNSTNRPKGRGKNQTRPRRLVLYAGLKSSMIVAIIFETPPHADWDGQPWKFTIRIVYVKYFPIPDLILLFI